MIKLFVVLLVAYVVISLMYAGYLLGKLESNRHIEACEAYIEALENHRDAANDLLRILGYDPEAEDNIIDFEPVERPDGTVAYQMSES